jgi:cytochrome c
MWRRKAVGTGERYEEKTMLRRTLVGAALAAAVVDRAGAQPAAAPPDSEQARRVVALVEKAAALVQREGKAAFPEMRRRGSEWWDGTTYVFAYDDDLNILLQPAVPAREGTNPGDEKDVNGKAFHQELRRVARTGSGWVDYMLPRPRQTQPARKWSYVKGVMIDGKPGFVGAGFYPD